MLRHGYGVSILLFISYGLIFIVGFIANGFLLAAIGRTQSMRTTTNIFIGNLAVADLLVTVFCVPFTLAANLLSG